MLSFVKLLFIVGMLGLSAHSYYDQGFSDVITEVYEKYHVQENDWCDLVRQQIFDLKHQYGRSLSFEELKEGGVDADYLDLMALEYCKKYKDSFISIIWPRVDSSYESMICGILKQYCTLVYQKKFTLKGNGPRKLLFSIPEKIPYPGHYHDYFPKGMKEYPMMCFVLRANGVQEVTQAKYAVRKMLHIEPFSIHVNDTHPQCLDLAHMLLNNNSIDFLNNHKPKKFPNFISLIEMYRAFLAKNHFLGEDFCVDGSNVLSVYGIRDTAVDFDFLCTKHSHFGAIWPLDHHNSTWIQLGLSVNEIIYNPKNFFFFEGVKFASLLAIRDFKEKQGRDKDKQDIMLIDSFLRARNSD